MGVGAWVWVLRLWRLLLIRSRENGPFLGGLFAEDALSGARSRAASEDRILVNRDATHRCARFFFDFFFAVAASAPASKCKSRFDGLLEFFIIRCGMGVRAAERQ